MIFRSAILLTLLSTTSLTLAVENTPEERQITPSFYQLEDDYGGFATVEFLYWYAKETGLPYAINNLVVNRNPGDARGVMTPKTWEYIDVDWDPGFRIGLGYRPAHDGWDTYLHWTYYHNKASASTSVPEFSNITTPGNFMLLNPWIDQGNFVSPYFFRIAAQWSLNYNVIDWELGRKFWISDKLALRPYGGIRGAWTKTHFRTVTEGLDPAIIQETILNRFTTNYWGVGLVAGLQPAWHFTSNWSIFGDADVSLLWGKFDLTSKGNNFVLFATTATDFDYSWIANNDFYLMRAVMDLATGIRWESDLSCQKYHIGFDLGWEYHLWFDQNQLSQFTGRFDESTLEGYRNMVKACGNLVLSGLVVRGRFDF